MNTSNQYSPNIYGQEQVYRSESSQDSQIVQAMMNLSQEIKKLRHALEERTRYEQETELRFLRRLLAERFFNEPSAFGCDTSAMVRSLRGIGRTKKKKSALDLWDLPEWW